MHIRELPLLVDLFLFPWIFPTKLEAFHLTLSIHSDANIPFPKALFLFCMTFFKVYFRFLIVNSWHGFSEREVTNMHLVISIIVST